MAETCDKLYISVLQQFLAMVQWKDLRWGEHKELPHLSIAQQDVLVSSILNSSIVTKFPPSRSYQRNFLKNIIRKLEEYGMEVSENLYVMYSGMVQVKDNQEEFCYHSYYIEEHITVTLKESVSLLSHGTTGLRTWEASFILTEWIMGNHPTFKSKHVIELGSGLGLAGIATLRALEPKSYVFTDCHPSVLDVLKENIELNAKEANLKCTSYSVEQLDWQDCENNQVFQRCYDVVLASDVVFDTSLVPSLVNVIARLLSLQSSAVAVIATTIRNEDTYACFKEMLEREGLKISVMSPPSHIPTLYYNRFSNYEMLTLRT